MEDFYEVGKISGASFTDYILTYGKSFTNGTDKGIYQDYSSAYFRKSAIQYGLTVQLIRMFADINR